MFHRRRFIDLLWICYRFVYRRGVCNNDMEIQAFREHTFDELQKRSPLPVLKNVEKGAI